MATMNKERLTAFSPCLTSFVHVSEDNRVKVWDAASGALRVELKERDHLNYKYTCLAWSAKSPWAVQGGKKNKRPASSGLGIVALGTSTGSIVVWDLEKGEVVSRLARENNEHGHGSAVQDIVFSSTGNSLFSCASEKYVLEWNVKEASMVRKIKIGSEGATKLALSSNDEVLAAGSSSIKLFDVASGKKSKRLTFGHASAVTQLFFSECGRYVFSSSSERFVNVFDTKSDENDPLFNFACDSTPIHVNGRVVVAKKAKNSTATVVATTDAGAAFVWQHAMTSSSKPIAPVAKIIQSSVVVAALTADTSSVAVTVARGAVMKPHFETVAAQDDEGAFIGEITLEALDTTSLLMSKSNKKAKQDEASSSAHVPSLIERGGSTKTSTMVDVTYDAEDDEDDDEDEATLEERVQALTQELEEAEDADIDTVLTENYKSTSRARAQASSSSLVTVLEQALQSKDSALLESCLRVHDIKVIDETCRRLSPTKVFPFLLLLVEKFEKRPTRGATMCVWIKYLMLNHTAYLMTVPDVVDKLSGLYQSLDARLKVFPQLHKLNGRLNLVLGQIAGRATTVAVDETPAITFNEEDEQESGDEEDEEEEEEDEEEGDNDDEEDDSE